MGCRGCSCSAKAAASSAPVPKVIRKSLQNSPESPWFDWIANGTKRYEGRLLKEEWATLSVNDVIIFVSPDNRELPCRVLNLPHFKSFVAAFEALGSSLIPIPGFGPEDAGNLYRQYFKDEEVNQFGVVAVEVVPINCA